MAIGESEKQPLRLEWAFSVCESDSCAQRCARAADTLGWAVVDGMDAAWTTGHARDFAGTEDRARIWKWLVDPARQVKGT